ncbi:MAG: peptidase S9 family protein [Alphaproteobacteria bacterium]|nr:MAG: peptidase S9 family protein [Alphaproteobacteria bacterium]
MRILLVAATIVALAIPASAQTAPQREERGALRVENVPATPPDVSERLRQYVNTRSAGFADWLPDGGVLIYTRFGDTVQLHRVDQPMGARTQLTFYEERITGASVKPGANEILFTRDVGGDENYAGYLLDPATGRASLFTEPGTRNEGFIWSDDGQQVAWSYVPASEPNYDIYVGEGEAHRRVFDGEGAVYPVDFSADGRRLLVRRYISIAESRLMVLDTASNEATQLTPEIAVAYGGGEFTPDGRSVVTVSDENAQFQRLVRIDLASGARTVLTPNLNWGVESFDLSPDGRTIAYVVNEAGRSSLRLMDARTLRALPGPQLPPGIVSGVTFDRDGRRLGFTLNSSTAPGDVYSWDLRQRRLTRWTASETGGIPQSTFIDPELISWTSFDGREISGFLYRPRTPGPHPVIVQIHGGPESQFRPGFSPTIQYWVNELGVAVIAPNVRGSSGYGRDFLALDNGPLREDSVRDIGALLDWIDAEGTLDNDRVIVYGGSYGGYMVLASMTHYNDRLAGAVDIVGISNFATFLENTSGYRRDLRRAEYGDERDPEMRAVFDRISPLNNIGRVNKPIFVIHGYNDPRVPVSEAEQVYAAVRRNGGEAWLMIAMNEGHGFARRENQEAQREAETLFFRRVLGLDQ